MVVFSLSIALSFWRLELYLILDFRCTCLLCFMFYVLCFMFYVLCFMFYVLCFMFYVFLFYFFTNLLIYFSSLFSTWQRKSHPWVGRLFGGFCLLLSYSVDFSTWPSPCPSQPKVGSQYVREPQRELLRRLTE